MLLTIGLDIDRATGVQRPPNGVALLQMQQHTNTLIRYKFDLNWPVGMRQPLPGPFLDPPLPPFLGKWKHVLPCGN